MANVGYFADLKSDLFRMRLDQLLGKVINLIEAFLLIIEFIDKNTDAPSQTRGSRRFYS